jgi:aminopeptidase
VSGSAPPVTAAALLDQLAELAVRAGMNLQPGQVVGISTEIGKEDLTRAAARAAYRAGAKFVDVNYFDVHVKHARLELAEDETLDYVPPWYGGRLLALGKLRGARLTLAGPAAPGLLADIDPVRTGRDRLPWVEEILTLISDRTTNWTIIPCPTPGWAALVHPDLEQEEAFARLCDEIADVCRLDAADPVGAWRERMDELDGAAARLTERSFDALHFLGPGTDLTLGLFPGARWVTARFETVTGIRYIANIPSEEVFTSPDPARTEGLVSSTKPLVLADGTIIRGLVIRFEQGRAVAIEAEEGAEVMRGRCAADEGAARLGEVALVDREGRIGRLGTAFYDTLLDENAASHLAVGNGFDFVLREEDRSRVNGSAIHIDFMVGGDDVDVTGITAGGGRVPVLRGGAWQI